MLLPSQRESVPTAEKPATLTVNAERLVPRFSENTNFIVSTFPLPLKSCVILERSFGATQSLTARLVMVFAILPERSTRLTPE